MATVPSDQYSQCRRPESQQRDHPYRDGDDHQPAQYPQMKTASKADRIPSITD
jgi:hypothetical protein